jgi:hypothetical protein
MADDSKKQDSLFDSIEQISIAKSTSENRVRLLRALVDDSELTKAELRPIQIQYDEARARVNASFDRILVELETTSGKQPTASFEKLAQRASEEVGVFVEAADAVILGEDRSGAAAAAIGAGPGLFGSLVDIWKTLRGEKQTQRTALIARVEALKWDAFDAVQ